MLSYNNKQFKYKYKFIVRLSSRSDHSGITKQPKQSNAICYDAQYYITVKYIYVYLALHRYPLFPIATTVGGKYILPE